MRASDEQRGRRRPRPSEIEVTRVPVQDRSGSFRAAGPAGAPRAARRRLRVSLPLLLLLLPAGFLAGRSAARAARADAQLAGVVVIPGLTTRAAGGDVASPALRTGAVGRFAAWTGEGGRSATAVSNVDRAAEGIALMADALAETAGPGGGSENDRSHVAAVRAHGEQLRRTGDETMRAGSVRGAFVETAGMLAELQGGSPELSTALMRAATAVSPTRPLRLQGVMVREFFARAAATMQALSPGHAEPRALGR